MAMYEGKIATKTIAENILNTLISDGYYDLEKDVVIAGNPADSSLFEVTDNYDNANAYAKFGSWNWGAQLDNRSWAGVFHYFLGCSLSFAANKNDTESNIIVNKTAVQEMPCYPADGSIQIIDDCIVIKVAQN